MSSFQVSIVEFLVAREFSHSLCQVKTGGVSLHVLLENILSLELGVEGMSNIWW
jgi:hypothetical protein